MNEDLLNPRLHNLKDVLLLNSLQNIIGEPTRQPVLFDPKILHEEMSTFHFHSNAKYLTYHVFYYGK